MISIYIGLEKPGMLLTLYLAELDLIILGIESLNVCMNIRIFMSSGVFIVKVDDSKQECWQLSLLFTKDSLQTKEPMIFLGSNKFFHVGIYCNYHNIITWCCPIYTSQRNNFLKHINKYFGLSFGLL